jgi:disulfide bond formation protein DsbB
MSLLITLMALGTVALNAALALALLALFNSAWRTKLFALIRSNARLIFFLLSAASVAGTLFFEFAAGLAPCTFCWWQRIGMYPILFISAIAFLKNTDVSEIADYILALSIFGGAFALYQHLLQVLPTGTIIPCDASGDCAVRSIFEFGFVTIPWMALSVFAVFIFVALIARKK